MWSNPTAPYRLIGFLIIHEICDTVKSCIMVDGNTKRSVPDLNAEVLQHYVTDIR